MVDGILAVNKSLGSRSTNCVAAVRRILGDKQKVGHAGTLDSSASGVLVILLGRATRLSDAVLALPKSYVATVQFGYESDTDDWSGNISAVADPGCVDEGTVYGCLPMFLGTRMQVPPRVSAVHVDGVRAHKLARSGADVEIKPRPVRISSMDILGFNACKNQVTLRVECHSGTYIRSLARDLGRALGVGGYLAGLVRESIGDFRADDLLALDTENKGIQPSREEILERVVSPSVLSSYFYSCRCGEDLGMRLWQGMDVSFGDVALVNLGSVSLAEGIMVLSPGLLSVCDVVHGDGLKLHARVNVPLGREFV